MIGQFKSLVIFHPIFAMIREKKPNTQKEDLGKNDLLPLICILKKLSNQSWTEFVLPIFFTFSHFILD